MSVVAWLSYLVETGRSTVSPPGVSPDPDEDIALLHLLGKMDASARLDAPAAPPELSPPAAMWAARMLHHAAQFFVYREIDAAIVREALAEPCPEKPSPHVCWSVDLVFRYLPDLLALARGFAQGDALVAALTALARNWPLSSVGVKNAGDVEIDAFIENPSLRRLYADRIIERSDAARLSDPRAAEAVREALGGFPELAPALGKALGFVPSAVRHGSQATRLNKTAVPDELEKP